MFIQRLLITIIFLAIASVCDVENRKIPNWLTFPMILSGLLLDVFLWRENMLLVIIALVTLFFLGMVPGIGLGDIKLLMGIACHLGPAYAFIELAAASLCALFVRFIRDPAATQVWVSLRFYGMGRMPGSGYEKTKENSVALAPYLLFTTVCIGGLLLC